MIFKVTTRHAICAAMYLAENGIKRVVTADEIANKRGIPISYLPRILSKMAKNGVIKSFHGGRERGYRVVRDLDTISLFEILDIFEGWSDEGCLLRPSDERCQCSAKYYWDTIENCMFAPLKKITLGTLCSKNTKATIKKILSA